MGRRGIGKDEEFTGNVLEEDKGERFNGMATKGGGEEEEMTRIMGGKVEFTGKSWEEMDVIVKIRGEEERLSKGIEGRVGEDEGVVKMGEGRGGNVMA